jgi:hypothetical protein
VTVSRCKGFVISAPDHVGAWRERGPELSGRVVIAVLVAFALAPIAPASAQSRFTIVEIGTRSGFDDSTGSGINESAQVVGTLQQSPYGASSAFVWDRASGLRALGTFKGRATAGGGINDRGEVAGTGVGFVYDPGTAFRGSAAGGFEPLGFGAASGINDAREVSGTALGPAPLRWDAVGRVQSIGSLGGTQGSRTR